MTVVDGLRTFRGAVAVVTGGASGIGRALSLALAQRGAEVVLADLQLDLAQEAAARIQQAGGKATAAPLDVTEPHATERLVRQTVDRCGRLDYMFNNAGIIISGEVHLYQIEDWYRILDVNLRGVVHGVQAAYPLMVEQGFGHIVNTASLAGLTPTLMGVGYSTSKCAVVGLSTALRIEGALRGVRVSVLCPGYVRTPIVQGGGKFGKQLQKVPPEVERALRERLRPMDPGRFARKALPAVAKNRAIIVIPSWWKIPWWLYRFSPSLALYARCRLYEHVKRELESMLSSVSDDPPPEPETPGSAHDSPESPSR